MFGNSLEKGNKKTCKSLIYRVLQVYSVLEAGIEPAQPKLLDFESSASTSSATRASGRQK